MAVTPLHDKDSGGIPNAVEPDKYFWDRLMRTLIIAGYGDHEKVAGAELVAAATFLYLGDDVDERLKRHLNS